MGRDDESSTVMLTADTGTGRSQVWDNTMVTSPAIVTSEIRRQSFRCGSFQGFQGPFKAPMRLFDLKDCAYSNS